MTSGTGQVGFWGGQSFATRADWFYELGFDAHSLSADPLFINPLGADGQLGYRTGSTTVRTTIFTCSTARRLSTPATRPHPSALNRHPTAAA